MSTRDLDMVIAGHLCLDIIPKFSVEEKQENIVRILIPGKMIDMGRCVVVGGGPVTNAGVSIRRLGAKVELIGKVGDDEFGRLVFDWYERHEGHFAGLRMSPGESTSYTIAICIPGVDRFYLHHCGANDTYGYDDVDFRIVDRAGLFLFGYPPWMKKIYENQGVELTRILKDVKARNVTTVLDLSIPDIEGYAGRQPWRRILEDWIPLADVMVPSAEEIFLFLDRDRFMAKKKEVGAHDTVLNHMSVSDIQWLGSQMLALGTGVAMVKCGHRGLYVRTAGRDRLARFGAAKPADLANWADRELWFPVYQEERFVGALGSGDSAIAGFLTAFVRGRSIESCLRYANAAGSMNVTVPDGLTWNKGFDDLTRRIESGWKTKPMTIALPGWRQKGEFWAGPNDAGRWESR
jgi:sugar/nucleoside kinase (ribokinase family)